MKKNILLIEDNRNNHLLIVRVLEKDGYRVIAQENAIEAYKYLSHEAVDLIITDYGLPDETGVEIATKLRADAKTTGIPIIILTAGTFDADTKIHHQSVSNAVLRKPIDFPVLRKTVSDLLVKNP